MSKRQGLAFELSLMSFFLSLLILGAYLRIPLGFMTITLQLVLANLCGLLMGAKRSFLICLVYMLMGLIGLPVFASGAGPSYVLQPTFGYIVGFTLAVGLGGLLFRDKQADATCTALLYTLFTTVFTYLIGATHFYLILNFYLGKQTSLGQTLAWAVFATIPKDLILGAAAAITAVRVKRIHLIGRK